MTTSHFYDELASTYDLVFADWDASIERQGRLFRDLLTRWGVPEGAEILDCSCGIGTQALALASNGYAVCASDISVASVDRARLEARRRELTIEATVTG